MDHLKGDKGLERHLKALKTDIFNQYDLRDVVKFLEDKTYLDGNRFSFKGHEVHRDVLSDISQAVNVQKCAQIGMSEAMTRYALGLMAIMPYFNIIMTMPSSTDAGNYARTRIDPTIKGSKALRDIVDNNLNNTEIKSLGTCLLYLKGTLGTTAALSVPADLLIHDEVDRSDKATIGQYQSRLKHSDWRLTRRFGTPTQEKVGIADFMSTSMRKRHLCKCHHCNHWFAPNYHDHVVIPDFDLAKQEITKHMLGMIRWQDAVLLCPRCGKAPSLAMANREWVVENKDDHFLDIGYYMTPFSFPDIEAVSMPNLVKESTAYASWEEFVNQALGETAADDGKSLTEKDIANAVIAQGALQSSEVHCMGVDVGQTCHIMIGRTTMDGMFLVVHKERCLLADLPQRKLALQVQYAVVMTVIDAFPETYMVTQMQKQDANLWGAVYHQNRKLAVYELVKVAADATKGKLPVNQAKIHGDLNFDEIMNLFKANRVRWAATTPENDALFLSHALDMTRKAEFDSNNTMVYVWEKSKTAQDHFFHALGYLHVACQLAPTAQFRLPDEGFSLGFSVKMNESMRPGHVVGAMG